MLLILYFYIYLIFLFFPYIQTPLKRVVTFFKIFLCPGEFDPMLIFGGPESGDAAWKGETWDYPALKDVANSSINSQFFVFLFIKEP